MDRHRKRSSSSIHFDSLPGDINKSKSDGTVSLSLEQIYSDGDDVPRSTVARTPRRGSRYKVAPPIGSNTFARRPVLRSRSVHMLSNTIKIDPNKERDGEDDDDDDDVPVTICSATKRQKLILVCLAFGELLAYTSYSLLAPFYPQEATDRNISATTSGWVFAVFSLVQFVAAPILGKLVPTIGLKFMLLCGAFVTGCCTILFGVLDELPYDDYNNLLFTIFCFLVRMVLALGATAWATASFAIATSTFSENPATVMGLMETAVGIGLMVGPAVGGVLYQAGGFKLPFMVIGVIILVTLPLQFFVLEKDEVVVGEPESGSVMDLLRIPAIPVVGCAVFSAASLWTILDPTLEPHLRQFELSPSQVGLVFVLLAVCYAVLAPVAGLIADKVDDSTPMMIAGFSILSVAYILLGPSPFTGLDDYLWLNLVAVSIMGVGMSLAIVPTFDKIIWSAEKSGIEDTLGMHGAVAGLFNSIYALGETVGPGLSGWLVETQGFPWSMTYCAILALFMVVALFFLWFFENCTSYLEYKYPNGEQEPLLRKQEEYKFVNYDCEE